MIELVTDAFEPAFMQRALLGGLVAVVIGHDHGVADGQVEGSVRRQRAEDVFGRARLVGVDVVGGGHVAHP